MSALALALAPLPSPAEREMVRKIAHALALPTFLPAFTNFSGSRATFDAHIASVAPPGGTDGAGVRGNDIVRGDASAKRMSTEGARNMGGTDGFRDKVALVVGGASGMGNATLRLLNEAGCRTHVFDIKETADGTFHRCDIRDYAQVRDAVRNLVDKEGRIDLLFVAAGIHLFATIEDTSIEDLERVVAINLKGPFHVLKEVLPVMRGQRCGNIVLMGSDQVHVGKGSSAAYGMSKAAIGQLTKSTAIDYAPFNIRVNCICPGTIDTPMIAPAVDRFHRMSGMPVEKIHEMLKTAQPIKRLGTPEEIGRLVLFLLSDDCAYMTGALISADGGYTSQ